MEHHGTDRTYTPAGNRRFTAFGGGTPAAQGSYAGWDRFGRVARQAWVDGAGGPGSGGLPNRPPVLETAYGYDRASNRLFARDVRPGAKLPDRDWQHEHDGLDRLKEAERGAWNGSTLVTGVGGQRWDLDMLGNWTAFRRDLAGNGLYASVETREHNAANEITALDPDGGGGAPQLPFAYDDAGNMRTRDRSPGTQSVYTHDAWNRLVKVQAQPLPSGGPVTLQESEYNGLHWRTVRRLDTTTPANGLDQMRVMHYSASWQVLQEDIDDGFNGTYSPDRRAQQFWGLRYIDDAIARRSKATLAGSYALPWFYVTDAQFSVAAVLNASGKLVERVRYDPYGTASHHWPGDVDGDGDEDKDDENLVTASYGAIGSGAYNADADINRDGVVDAADLALVGKNAALAKGTISDPAGPDSPVGYCGYLFSRETGLYTVRFRHYDTGLGVWLENDPEGYRDGPNRYTNGRSNPVRFTDPMGTDAWDTSGPIYNQMSREEQAKTRQQLKECVVKKLKELAESQRKYQQAREQYERERATNPNAAEPQKPEEYDCADSAITMLARCARENRLPLRLWAGGKWWSHRDYDSPEAFEAALRRAIGAINLMDKENSRPQEWRDLEPGDLLLWDLRSHRSREYTGHTAVVVDKATCEGEPCWKVLEGHLTGGLTEASLTQEQAKNRWGDVLWEKRGRYWNWRDILQ